MAHVSLGPFELAPDGLRTESYDGTRLSVSCTDPLLAVHCSVLHAHPDAVAGRAAILAVNDAAQRHCSGDSTKVVDVYRLGDLWHGVVLEGSDWEERIAVLAHQQGDKVLLVQGRCPAHAAEEATALISELLSPVTAANAAKRE